MTELLATRARPNRTAWELPADARPLLVVYLLLLLFIPARLVIGPLGAPGAPAALLAIVLLLWWATGRMLWHPRVRPGGQPVRLVLLLLTIATLASYFVGMVMGMPALQMSGADRGLLSMFGSIGVSLVATDMLHSRESVDRLLRLLTYLTAIVAVIGILQFVTGLDLSKYLVIPGLTANGDIDVTGERSSFRRVAGTTSHQIEFGVILAAVYPIALHYALDHQRARAWLRWGVVVVITVAIPMAVSRSAVIGLSLGLVVLFIGWSGWRRAVAVLVIPLVILAMRVAIPGLLGTLVSGILFWSRDDSIQGRTDDYAVVGAYIERSPWLGTGFGTLIPKDFIVLDNQFLGVLVEMGVLGLVSLLLLFGVGFACCRGAALRAPDNVTRSLATSLSASVVVLAFSFAQDFDGLGFPVAAGLLFLLLGVIGALWRLTGGSTGVRRIPKRWLPRRSAGTAAVISSVGVGHPSGSAP